MRARRSRGCCLGCRRGSRRLAGRGSDEGRRWCRRGRHVEFSQAQISTDVGKGGERALPGDELGHELEALVEAAQDVQHKSAILNGLAEVSKSVSHAFHLAAVIVDGEGTLGESTELGVDEHGAGLAVVEELLFQTKPSPPSRHTLMFMDDIQKVGGDGVENPGNDHAVHASPRGIVEVNDVTEDVILQSEAAEREEDVAAPFGEIGSLEVQNDRDKVPDVLNGSGLAVQVGDGRRVGGDGAVQGLVVVGLHWAEALPEDRGLPFQGVGLRAFLLEGGSGGTNAFLSSRSGFEEAGLRLELQTALSVGGVQGGGFFLQLLGGGESFIAKLGCGSRGGLARRRGSHGRGAGRARRTEAGAARGGGRGTRRARDEERGRGTKRAPGLAEAKGSG
jgi:hypothetical protein